MDYGMALNERINILCYVKSKSSLCSKKCKEEQTINGIFVDNFFVFSNSKDMIKDLKTELTSTFKINDLGLIIRCLGMWVKIYRSGWFWQQILKKFSIKDCNIKDTAMEYNLKLEKTEYVD